MSNSSADRPAHDASDAARVQGHILLAGGVTLLLTFLAAFLAERTNWEYWILAPDIPIFLCGILWFRCARSSDDSGKYADGIYFIGYLATIISLLLLAYSLWDPLNREIASVLSSAPNSGSPAALQFGDWMVRGAFAVSSTAGGLVGMFFLRQKQAKLGSFEAAEANNTNASTDQAGPAGLATAFERIAQAQEEASAKIKAMGDDCATLGKAIKQVSIDLQTQSAVFTDAFLKQQNTLTTALEGVLQIAAAKQTEALGPAIAKLTTFAAGLDTLDASVEKISGHLTLLESASGSAGVKLQAVAEAAGGIEDTATKLASVAKLLEPTWQKLEGQVAAATDRTAEIQALGEALTAAHASTTDYAKNIAALGTSSSTAQAEITQAVKTLHGQLGQLNQLSDGVTRSVLATKELNQVLANITQNLGQVGAINDAVKLLGGHVNTLSKAMADTANSTGELEKNSRQLTLANGTLVQQIHNQAHQLKSLTEPFGEFAANLKLLEPNMETLSGHFKQLGGALSELGDFKQRIGQADQNLVKWATSVAESMDRIQGLEKLLRSFVSAAVAAEMAKAPPGRKG